MAKLSDVLTALAKKAGVDLTDPKFADIMAATLEVPDDLFNSLDKNLMSEDAAFNNSKIRNKIKAELYNGIDSDVNGLIDEFELEEDVKKNILEEKKSVDRIKKLASHLKEQSEKSAKAGDKTQAEAYRRQVEELNNQLKTLKTENQKTIDQLKADNEANLTGFQVKSLLAAKKFTLPDAMKSDEQVETVFAIVNQELAKNGFKLNRENGSLRLLKSDGTDPYDEKNNKLELTTFIDGALAQRGLLKVSDPANPGDPGNDPTPQKVTHNPQKLTAPQTDGLSQIDALIKEAEGRSN